MTDIWFWLLSFAFDFDGFSSFGLWKRYGKYTFFARGLDFGCINVRGEVEVTSEAAAGALEVIVALFLFLLFGLFFSADGKGASMNGDVDVVGFAAWDFGFYEDGIFIFRDIDSRPDGAGRFLC